MHTHPRSLADFSISQQSVLKKSNTLKTNRLTSSEYIPSKLFNVASNAIVSFSRPVSFIISILCLEDSKVHAGLYAFSSTNDYGRNDQKL